MNDYEINAEEIGTAARALAVHDGYREWETLFPARREEYLQKARAVLIRTAPLIAAAAYCAGQEQAAQEIAERIETTGWLNCAAFARKARDYGAMVTS